MRCDGDGATIDPPLACVFVFGPDFYFDNRLVLSSSNHLH